MVLVVLFIGIILLVSALRNSYGALFTAIGTDVPGFVVWAAAILALGAIGFIPGFKPVSRGLLALVIVVLVFQNYSNILLGFQEVAKPPVAKPGPSGGSPVAPAYGVEMPGGVFGSDGNQLGNSSHGVTDITIHGGANG